MAGLGFASGPQVVGARAVTEYDRRRENADQKQRRRNGCHDDDHQHSAELRPTDDVTSWCACRRRPTAVDEHREPRVGDEGR